MKFFKKLKLIFILFLLITTNISANNLKKVSLQLSWFDQFQFAGYYIAKEKGFYKEVGLDVEIRPFKLGINIASLVNNKKVDFGIDRETLILERSNHKKVTVLYALFQTSPLVLLATKESKINFIEDFIDKKIMTTNYDSSEVSIRAMIISKNIKMSELNFIKHTHDINDLINKNTDIISGYLSKSLYALNKNEIEYNIFKPKDYGFDMYSDFLFTNEDKVNNDLYTVLAFKEASLKAWKYAYENIDETVQLIYDKYNSQNLTIEELKFEAIELKKLSYVEGVELGNIKKSKIQRIYDLYNLMGVTRTPIDLNKFIFYEKHKKSGLSFKDIEYIHNKKEIKMCIVPSIKPYSYIKEGEFMGFVADYIKLVEKKTSLKFKLINTKDIVESLDFLEKKKCDILSSSEATKERKVFANFTESYFDIPLVLISNNNFAFIDDLKVLNNKRIGLVRGYSSNTKVRTLYPEINFIYVKDLEEGMKRVLAGELDGHIDLLYTSWNKLYEGNFSKLKISGKLDESIPISIAVRDDDILLYDILNKVVKNIKQKEINDILKKWVTIEYKEKINYDTLWKVLFFVSLIFLSILYRQRVLKNMNKSLKELVSKKTKELQDMNMKLEERVKNEVEKNLRKDTILSKQSKFVAMGEMIQNIAHQWRQPLSIISTGASGLKLQKELNGKIDDALLEKTLSSIVDTSMHLSNTIDDFMYFFKPNKSRIIFKLSSAFDKTFNIFDTKIRNGKIKIIKNIDDIEINSFESELIQVFINIMNNAKDALDDSSFDDKFIFIDVKMDLNKNVIIELKDNAGGIDEQVIGKIFEPYFTTKHKYQGTGVGLYMCQEIVGKHMDGKIEVFNTTYKYKSTEYKGAKFIITLNC